MRDALPLPAAASSSFSPQSRFLRLAHLRRLKQCEQVAAVCYRVRGREVEFLLVQTRGGRWTFPKGSSEPGLTHAQAAALEAFEEAGVHGRIEEASFTRYIRRKRSGARPGKEEIAVSAYLCEVRRLERPAEFDRHPTWFSPEKAKRRLQLGRKAAYGDELTRVVERAVARIRRLHRNSEASQLVRPQVELMRSLRPVPLLTNGNHRARGLKAEQAS